MTTNENEIIAVREIKLTLSFAIAKPFYRDDLKEVYIKKINDYVKRVILEPFNGKYPDPELTPMMAYLKTEDITD
jgi:hypothetical protein